MGESFAAASDDCAVRFSGGTLDRGKRGGAAGRQRSSDWHSDRRVPDRRRLHQYRRRRAGDVGAAVQSHAVRAPDGSAGVQGRDAALEEPQAGQRRGHGNHAHQDQRTMAGDFRKGRHRLRSDLQNERY